MIVPLLLRPVMREEIHNSHLGIQACLRRARQCVFWPAMNAEIKDNISECEICQSSGLEKMPDLVTAGRRHFLKSERTMEALFNLSWKAFFTRYPLLLVVLVNRKYHVVNSRNFGR